MPYSSVKFIFLILLLGAAVFYIPAQSPAPLGTEAGRPAEKLADVLIQQLPAKQEEPEILSLGKIKECLGKTGASGECLDEIFREYLKSHTTKEALAVLQKYEDEDTDFRYGCHPVVHAVGRETFRAQKTLHDSFVACEQTCHSGCYHGAMERFLREESASDDESAHISEIELENKVASACDPNQPERFRFQCLHGLGHALMFFLDYKLERALEKCDIYSDGWSRSSCYGGVFMENIFAADPAKRDLSKIDFHYPCNKLKDRYKGDCYMMQTTRMSEMGLGTVRLFDECKNAGGYELQCAQSVGRDLSNEARIKDPRLTSQKCELVSGEARNACVRGVIFALIDNTWDGKYAFPFCASFASKPDADYCFSAAETYIKGIYGKK